VVRGWRFVDGFGAEFCWRGVDRPRQNQGFFLASGVWRLASGVSSREKLAAIKSR
jgi:hypothetical protein